MVRNFPIESSSLNFSRWPWYYYLGSSSLVPLPWTSARSSSLTAVPNPPRRPIYSPRCSKIICHSRGRDPTSTKEFPLIVGPFDVNVCCMACILLLRTPDEPSLAYLMTHVLIIPLYRRFSNSYTNPWCSKMWYPLRFSCCFFYIYIYIFRLFVISCHAHWLCCSVWWDRGPKTTGWKLCCRTVWFEYS